MSFWIAQIIGILGSGAAIIGAQMKDKKKYLLFYALSYCFFVINMILLKAYSGAINCFILMILTLISSKFEDKKIPNWLIIIFTIAILVGNVITYKNVFSLLPAIASIIYLVILMSKSMKKIRFNTFILRTLWAIYDFIVKAYTTFGLDIFSVLSTIIAIYRYDIKKKK